VPAISWRVDLSDLGSWKSQSFKPISIECVDQCLMTLFNLETVRDHISSAMQTKFAKYEGSADYHYFVIVDIDIVCIRPKNQLNCNTCSDRLHTHATYLAFAMLSSLHKCCHASVFSLADRTNGRAYDTVLHPSSVTLCIVAKWCVLEPKLLLTADTKNQLPIVPPKCIALMFV